MRLQGKKVLFFSTSYRPERSGIGPYSGDTAERLAAEGAQVTVVAGMPHYPSWRLSDSDRHRLRRREVLAGVRVQRLRQLVSRRQTALTRAAYEFTFLLNGFLSPVTWQRADLAVAVMPSLAGGLLARLSAGWRRVPLILIIQDLTTKGALESGIAGGRAAAPLVRLVESRLLRRADLVVLVHDSFRESCREIGVPEERIHVISNWSRQGLQQPGVTSRPDSWGERFVVLHAGNMGFKQGLEVVVDAARLAHLRGHHDLLFVLLGDGSRRDQLEHGVADLPTLQFLDPVDAELFPPILAAADLALVTQRAEVRDMSVPSKLTAYLNAGRAVVCSVSPLSGAAQEIERSSGGVTCAAQDPEALLDTVLELRASPDRVHAMEEAGQRYAVEFLRPKVGLDRLVDVVARAAQGTE